MLQINFVSLKKKKKKVVVGGKAACQQALVSAPALPNVTELFLAVESAKHV